MCVDSALTPLCSISTPDNNEFDQKVVSGRDLAISGIARFVNMGESNFKRSRNLRTGRQKVFEYHRFEWVTIASLPSALQIQNYHCPKTRLQNISGYRLRLLLAVLASAA